MLVSSNLTVGDYLYGDGAPAVVWMTGGLFVLTNATTVIGNASVGQLVISNGTFVAGKVTLGKAAPGTMLIAGGTNTVLSSLTLGDCGAGAVGTVLMTGGTLYVTNAAHTATLDVRDGTLTVSGGALVADKVVITNSCGHFIRAGGSVTIALLLLDSALDADGDGIPNGYEQSYGLDPLDSVNVTKDTDGDGVTDLEEFQAGTNPTNSASAFGIIDIVTEGNNVRVTWTMGEGKTNALQAAAGDSVGSFTNGFIDIFTVTNTVGGITNHLDLGGATNAPVRFYRVRLVP